MASRACDAGGAPTLVFAWVRKALRVHDNPLLVHAAAIAKEQPGCKFCAYFIDCSAVDEAVFLHSERHNRFIQAVQRYASTDVNGIGEETFSALQSPRKGFLAATLREFGKKLQPVPLHCLHSSLRPESATRLRDKAQGLTTGEARAVAAELRGKLAARSAQASLPLVGTFPWNQQGRDGKIRGKIHILLDRSYDPESLIEEQSFRRAFQDELPGEIQASFTAVCAHTLCETDFTAYVRQFPFATKPLAYNPFVTVLEKLGVGAPIAEADTKQSLQVLRALETEVVVGATEKQRHGHLEGLDVSLEDGVSVRINHGVACELLESTDAVVPAGESAAISRLNQLSDDFITSFSKPDTNPMQATGPSTTALSPYLANGSLSARLAYLRFRQAEQRVQSKGATATKPPQSLVGQLYWREFSYFLHFLVGIHFVEMQKNPVCLQRSDWNLDGSHREEQGQRGGLEVEWLRSLFFRGIVRLSHPFFMTHTPKTSSKKPGDPSMSQYLSRLPHLPPSPYTALNAGLSQLHQSGWAHHIMRHFIACYLTRIADMSWEVGRDYFDGVLLDYDISINASQWMWLSCSFLFYSFNRVYQDEGFARKHDRRGEYSRRWGSRDLDAQVLALREDYDLFHSSRNARPGGNHQADHAKHFRMLYDHQRDTVIKKLKAAFLRQDHGFLRNLQTNVVWEWKREDAEFAGALEKRIADAWGKEKKDAYSGPLGNYFDRNFPEFWDRVEVQMCEENKVTVLGCSQAQPNPGSAQGQSSSWPRAKRKGDGKSGYPGESSRPCGEAANGLKKRSRWGQKGERSYYA